MPNICIPLGYGSGPYGLMAYAGYQLCSEEAENEIVVEPTSNLRDLCIRRCN